MLQYLAAHVERLKAICGQRAWPQSWTRWNIEGDAVEDLRADTPLERVDVIHNETAVKSSESRSAAVARAIGSAPAGVEPKSLQGKIVGGIAKDGKPQK